MKKLFTILFMLNLFAGITFAANNSIQMNVVNVPLKSNLKTKYSAYRIEFVNVGMNEVKTSEIKCFNKINIADPSTMENFKTKKTAICSALALPTLGISLLFLIPDQVKMTNNMYSTMNEQSKYTPTNVAVYNLQNGGLLNTDNRILEPGQSIRFDLLVPINETPDMSATFLDLTTNKYIQSRAEIK